MSGDTIELKIGGQIFGGWKAVEVDVGFDAVAGSFRFDVTDRWPDHPDLWALEAGAAASVLVAGSLSVHAGTPQQADGIRRSYEADFKAWVLKLHVAGSDAERKQIALERPDAAAAAKRMWSAIQPNLAESWTVEPAAWLLKISSGLVTEGENSVAKPLMGDSKAEDLALA